MDDTVEDSASVRTQWKAHYQQYKKDLDQMLPEIKRNRESIRIEDIIWGPVDVDMESFWGTEAELVHEVEYLYDHDGREFDPKSKGRTPTFLFMRYAKEWAMHAQGIYYHIHFSKMKVDTKHLWIPSLDVGSDESQEVSERRQHVYSLARRARRNESSTKSEYKWEADAWADVFPRMRDDPYLEVDKREYMALVADTDPCFSHLTGTSTMVSRTPDATFGLATVSDRDAEDPFWTYDLDRDRLERLMLHPKYGLVSDAKISSIDLAFPFMVYEAKGWKGDCREARRQACSAAAAYLDLLDNLARQPGPTDTLRQYQTPESSKYQVFVLTSFGAHWHLLVGYRRARLETEHICPEMSESVYIFQRIWSGRITNEQNAELLLSLVDQIHNWAVTKFRTFVLDHLKPWHEACEDNYLFEWDSRYDGPHSKKRRRDSNNSEDLTVPMWVARLPNAGKRDFQERAKLSLHEALRAAAVAEGKYECQYRDRLFFTCMADSCHVDFCSESEWTHHMQDVHKTGNRQLAQLRWLYRIGNMVAEVENRAEDPECQLRYKYLSQIRPPTNENVYIINPSKRRRRNKSDDLVFP